MNEQIKEMSNVIPNNIIAYDGNPNGQKLYTEQREFIATALYNANYQKSDKVRQETAAEILNYLYVRLGNSALSDTELVKMLAIQYGVDLAQ